MDKNNARLMAEFADFLRPATILTKKHTDGTWCEHLETCKREHVIRREAFETRIISKPSR